MFNKKRKDNLFSYSQELMDAYSKTIQLTQIFNSHISKEEGIEKLNDWIAQVRKSDGSPIFSVDHFMLQLFVY